MPVPTPTRPTAFTPLAYGLVGAWIGLVLGAFALAQFSNGNSALTTYFAPLAILPVLCAATLGVQRYGRRSLVGRAIALAAAGSVVWSLGDSLFDWYVECESWPIFECANQHEPAYPSLVDVGYIGGLLLWAAAGVLLWRSLGIGLGDLRSMAWIPALATALTVYLAAPTWFTVGGVDVGADFVFGAGYTPLQIAVSCFYLLADIGLLTAAAVLWRRSIRFWPFRFAALGTLLLYVGDIVYNARQSTGVYDSSADISDFLYAGSIAALMVAFLAFDREGLREERQQHASLERLRARRRGTAGAT